MNKQYNNKISLAGLCYEICTIYINIKMYSYEFRLFSFCFPRLYLKTRFIHSQLDNQVIFNLKKFLFGFKVI